MLIISGNKLIQRYGLDYFKDASTLGALTDQALNYLLQKGKVLQLSNGERLFSYGDRVECFYIILDGLIGFYKPCEGGRCHIRDYSFGMAMGFMGVIGLQDRSGDAYAAESSLLLEVSTDLFSEMQKKMPNDFGVLLFNLAREMSRGLRDAHNRLAARETVE